MKHIFSTLLLLQLSNTLKSFSTLPFKNPSKPSKTCTERDPHQPVTAQVFRPLRGRLRLLLDGGRRGVHEEATPLQGTTEEVRPV
jgi:hypothetical protein